MGLNFKKELVLAEMQIFPPATDVTPTRLQVLNVLQKCIVYFTLIIIND